MTNSTVLQVNNVDIYVIKKDIKNIHLSVYPPNAMVKISAPLSYDNETIRLFAVSKWSWIKDNIQIIQNQTRIPPKDYISGESHYLFGKRYMLKVVTGNKHSVNVKGINTIIMTVKKNTSRDNRKKLMQEWYRKKLTEKLNVLIPKWEEKTGLNLNSWQIKKMKTKWGSCHIDKKTICLNLELAKRKYIEIEYVILHELSHLIEKTHNQRFIAHVEKYMPNWKLYRKELNSMTFE
ncbi:MAG: M48 family metallopeptidase [Neisseriaceae bacterium]|nr:M48 family metallopeptidase [Neisseriaceae bacterium]